MEIKLPDDALIRAVGVSELRGADKKHVKILAHQVSYLLTQMNVIANTFEPDEDYGIREHVRKVRENCCEKLKDILET